MKSTVLVFHAESFRDWQPSREFSRDSFFTGGTPPFALWFANCLKSHALDPIIHESSLCSLRFGMS